MKISPAVTVLMPVYNCESFLKEAIESILGQSFSDFELLAINDGSNDTTRDILNGIDDPRLVVVENERNIGLIHSLNKGLDCARGEFLARMDADDIALPTRLERQVKFLQKNPNVGLCGTWFRTFGEGKSTAIQPPTRSDDMVARLFYESPIGHPTVMFRRDLFAAHGLRYNDEFPHSEDYELWTRAAVVTNFANIPKVLLKYRFHSAQTTNRHSARQREIVEKIRLQQLDKLIPFTTDAERAVHLAILALDQSSIDIAKVEAWLQKLVKENESSKPVLPPKAFRRAIGLAWWRYCSSRTVQHGSLRAFFRSSLSAEISKKDKLRFLVRRLRAN